ncbi:MAG: efflux RND transporter periplasmic adaptor subunit [Planctomycetota bacterium]|jgi:HlyD family secretion protein
MNWKAITALILCGGVGVGGFFTLRNLNPPPEEGEGALQRFFEVKRGNLLIPIAETGTLKAMNSTRIRSRARREVKIIFLAKEGAKVKKGDELVKFETTEIDRQIDSDKQALEAAKAKLEAAKTDLEIKRTDWEGEIAKAELAVEEAVKSMEKYQEGELPLKEKENKIKLEEAETNLKRAKEKLEQMPELLKQGFVTPDRVEQKKIEVKKAEIAYESAKSELELFAKYTKPMELEKKSNAIAQARVALASAKKRIRVKSRQKETEVSTLEISLKKLQVNLEKLLEEKSKMEIKAPTDGLVIYGSRHNWGGGDEIKVGAKVWRHQTIITLPDLSRMQVDIRVHEMDIERIRKGMEVAVTVESAGSKSFTGKITKIAELANAGDWESDPEVKQFDVEVTIDDVDPGLKPGTTAKVEIVIEQLRGALYVPIRAVRGVGAKTFVYAERNGGLKRLEVELGLSNDKFVEIKSGVEEGDRILVLRPPEECLKAEEAEREKLNRERAESKKPDLPPAEKNPVPEKPGASKGEPE